MVMGGDSCSEGHGFESQPCILDGHFFILICCKICNDVCLKRLKRNDKRDRGWPNLLKNVHIWGGHHSSVISSAPTSLQPRVRIPSTQSTLFQYVVHFETVIVIGMSKGRK